MRFYHLFESLQAGAALGFIAAGACAVGLGNRAVSGLAGQVFADFLVAERMAKTNHHF